MLRYSQTKAVHKQQVFAEMQTYTDQTHFSKIQCKMLTRVKLKKLDSSNLVYRSKQN